MKILCSECFKNLGVASRAEIYNFIKSSLKASVSEVTRYVKLRQPTVSYHLKEMTESGLLCRQKNGRQVVYSINTICPHSKTKCIVA
ncbi:hypothetical protein A2982_03925 [candidate division WWE3 bacterium RIFCSPLOWO2_01_FULL_39_13]|uniref:HTH arsR-type domain-containing protein n=1 Tax=candidate division WWE3 bacterium RIFCSPLOWO2_01_FULL_39_13 TaxID=1802624 RepID=A0A1F4V3T1_UNCKA|nr:MAG: hypothetical protein A2982_03925 [candidate division WWE3 bacterium RIFCSPLOWO2_01_FULL_39_13]